jgi:hypothetical protein
MKRTFAALITGAALLLASAGAMAQSNGADDLITQRYSDMPVTFGIHSSHVTPEPSYMHITTDNPLNALEVLAPPADFDGYRLAVPPDETEPYFQIDTETTIPAPQQ